MYVYNVTEYIYITRQMWRRRQLRRQGHRRRAVVVRVRGIGGLIHKACTSPSDRRGKEPTRRWVRRGADDAIAADRPFRATPRMRAPRRGAPL